MVEGREQDLGRVEHHPLGPDRVDGVTDPHEEAVEVVRAHAVVLGVLEDDRVDRDELARVLAWIRTSGQTKIMLPPKSEASPLIRREAIALHNLLPIDFINPGGMRFKGLSRALLRWLKLH